MPSLTPTHHPESREICLADLKPLKTGKVTQVDVSRDHANRLLGLGVCYGRAVEVVQHGDPMILRVYGAKVAIAASLAERIRVQVETGAPLAAAV
jgi:Fe2+ transport system protein FeoA